MVERESGWKVRSVLFVKQIERDNNEGKNFVIHWSREPPFVTLGFSLFHRTVLSSHLVKRPPVWDIAICASEIVRAAE